MSQSLKHRPVRFTVAIMVAALLVLAIGVSSASAVQPPKVMASLGDSITRAFNAPNFGDNPANSWSTGDNPAVNSQFLRIQARDPNLTLSPTTTRFRARGWRTPRRRPPMPSPRVRTT